MVLSKELIKKLESIIEEFGLENKLKSKNNKILEVINNSRIKEIIDQLFEGVEFVEDFVIYTSTSSETVMYLLLAYLDNKGIEIIDTNKITTEGLKNIDTSDMIVDTYKWYIHQIKKYSLLSREEVIELCKKKDRGDLEARKILIEHNLRLAANRAFKWYYMAKYGNSLISTNMDICDFIQIANIGLIKAVDDYNYQNVEGSGLANFIVKYIWQEIHDEIILRGNNYMGIRFSNNSIKRLKYLRMQLAVLQCDLGMSPSIDDLSQSTSFKKETIIKYLSFINPVVDLDETIYTDDNKASTLVDFIKSTMITPQQYLEYKDRNNGIERFIRRCLNELNEKERYVIEQYYGLRSENGEMRSLESIGRDQFMLNKGKPISRQRVSILSKGAMKKMRNFAKLS
jgi:RNA polymerase primary sigma factor